MSRTRIEGVLGPNEILRGDGLRIERICLHGVGHPVRMTRPMPPESWVWIHGCDGCCEGWVVDARQVDEEPPSTRGPLHDANEAGMEKWAERYDELNGAPEGEEDR